MKICLEAPNFVESDKKNTGQLTWRFIGDDDIYSPQSIVVQHSVLLTNDGSSAIHTERVVVLPLQQSLREREAILRRTYIVYCMVHQEVPNTSSVCCSVFSCAV